MTDLEKLLEIRQFNGRNVYFRKQGVPLTEKSKLLELELIIKYLTGEEFEDFNDIRILKNQENFEVLEEYKESSINKYICLCSEEKCEKLFIIRHKPTNIYISVGSVCYCKFGEFNNKEFYYKFKAKNCENCKIPLIFKSSTFKRNTCKNNGGICFECNNIFLKNTIEKEKKENDILKKERDNLIKERDDLKKICFSLAEKNNLIEKENKNLKKENKGLMEEYDNNEFVKIINNLEKENDELTEKLTNLQNKYKQISLVKENKNIVYLNVPFDDKENAKFLGARWDVEKRKWYSYENNMNLDKLKKLYL